MLWEIANDIRRYIKMTFLPAMRNLFSSLRSLVGILLVMLVLQTLLSVICIFGIENIKNQQTVLDDFEAQLAAVSDTVESGDGSFLTSDTFKTALAGASIFLGALVIWGICAVTVYAKVTTASAERDKYIWGMYITHGAKKKKIRGMLKVELYILYLVATAIGYPAALALCNHTLREHGYEYPHSLLTLLVILALSYLCIRLVVAYQGFLIRSMSPTEFLREEDAPKSISFPRRHSKLIRGFGPLRYATNTFLRMRKYYVSLALIAALPAVIWVCFRVSATSQDAYLSREVNEFNVTLSGGISEEQLKELEEHRLLDINGISSVSASAAFDADKMYTHMLLDKGQYLSTDRSPRFTATYADSEVRLYVSDPHLKYTAGYSKGASKGKIDILYPSDGGNYSLSEGSTLYFVIPKDGSQIRVFDAQSAQSVKRDLGESYEFYELQVNSVVTPTSVALTDSSFTNINEVYFILHPDDYKKITSADPEAQRLSLDAEDYTVNGMNPETAQFSLTLPLNDFTKGLAEGDIAQISGVLSFDLSLTADVPTATEDVSRTWNVSADSVRFDYAYINEVTVRADSVTLTVTPHVILLVDEGLMHPSYFALGTPSIKSTFRQYFASTHDDFTLTNTKIILSPAEYESQNPNAPLWSESITLYRSSARAVGESGACMLLSGKQINDTSSLIQLEELFADNSFTLVCADETTLASFGFDASTSQSGATVVLPSSYTHLNIQKGDKIRLASTLFDVSQYNGNSEVQGGSFDLLATHLKTNKYEYVSLYVNDVIYSESAERAYVLVDGKSFSRVISKSNPYTSLHISIDSGIESKDYATIRKEISSWAATSPYKPTVSSTGNYLQYLLRKNANYENVLMLTALIIPLIVPFIWYYPLATLFDRRRTELRVLEAMGKTRRKIRACFMGEGILVSLCAFLAVFVLCAPAMFVFKWVCRLAKLPLSFEYSYLSLPLLLLAGTLSAICALVSFAVCYLGTSSGRIKKRRN